MLKFLHLSDLHFRGTPGENKVIQTTLDYIRHTYPTHILIVTGDIVEDGHAAQYRQARQALLPFLGRIYICPGNHDYGEKGNLYMPKREEYFDRYLSIPLQQSGTFSGKNLPVLHRLYDGNQRVLLIALNSNIKNLSPLDFACGQIGLTQLTALDMLLSDSSIADTIVMVFFHHHPFLHNDPLTKLLDARELMRILYGRVHLVLFGHQHVSKMWRDTLKES